MGKAIALCVVVSGVMAALAVFIAFMAMVAMNGFSEATAAKVFAVMALGFYAVDFLVLRLVARALLPEQDKPKARVIAGVLTAIPAVPTFGLLLML